MTPNAAAVEGVERFVAGLAMHRVLPEIAHGEELVRASDFDRIAAENVRLRAVVERLGSMEAFVVSRAVNKDTDEELLARIEYAQLNLAGTP